MESVLLKLEADVAARKRPQQQDLWATLRPLALAAALCVVAFELGAYLSAQRAAPGTQPQPLSRAVGLGSLADATGEVELQKAYIARLERIHRNSTRYGIGADLAATIEDIALAEGVSPKLAFELVRVESQFNPRAVSPVGAVGLTQVMPATARLLQPGISRKQLFDRETNLRLGFRFFKSLLSYYKGDVRLALSAYNRGPATVDRLLSQGQNPHNGYARMVLGR